MNGASPDRVRLYEHYVSSGQAGPAVGAADDLAPRAAYLRKLIADHLPQERSCRILDLGCGSGALLHFCREAGYHALEGIDVSPEQARAAWALGLDFVREGDLLSFLRAAAPASYDVIVALDVLEHFTREEVMDCLACVARALRPGGRFIIHVPNGESPFVGAIRYGDFTHRLAFTRTALLPLGRACGFLRISCHEDRPVVHGAASLVRRVLWHVMRAALLGITAVETGSFDRAAVFSRNLLAVMVKDGAAP